MIWYKAWLETRSRFAAATVVVIGIAAFFVLAHPWVLVQWNLDKIRHPEWRDPQWLRRASHDYPFFLWHFLYEDMLQKAYAIFAVLLGVGGLRREVVAGTAGFTLALPVSRRRLLVTRAVVTALELVVLAFTAALTVTTLSTITRQPYPILHGLSHGAWLALGGLVFAAVALLLSAVVEGEHAATLCALGALGLFYFMLQPYADGAPAPAFVRALNVARVMAGSPDSYAPAAAGVIGAIAFVAGTFLIALRITERRDC